MAARRQRRRRAQRGFALAQFLFLAKAHLGRDVGPGHAQRAALAAAALALEHVVADQRLHRLHRLLQLHRAVAGVVVQVAALAGRQRDALLEQVLVDVDDAAAGEDVFELVALQLVVAGAAADHHGLDVEVVQRVGDAVEQHPVVGDDLLGLVELARAALRIAAAQVARRQHGLHAGMPEHGLRGQADLENRRSEPQPGKVEHRLGVGRGRRRVADDRHVVACLRCRAARARSSSAGRRASSC